MELVNLKCPSCGGDIEKDGENYFCKSCGAAFAVKYDEADVEHEKLQNWDEITRAEHEHEKEMEEIRFKQKEKSKRAAERRESTRRAGRAFMSKIYGLIFVILFFSIGPISWWFLAKQGMMPSFKEVWEQSQPSYQKENYDISIDDLTDDVIDNMIDAGKDKITNSRKTPQTDYTDGEWVEYHLNNTEYDSAYLITNASEGENRVVVIYKLEYTSDSGDKITYDATYYDYLKLSENGTVVSNYVPKNITRSDSAWHRDSYENREQCYRENVLAFGGNVTEIENKD
ncbi:MAG: hypothetical protein K5654_08785 [Lachnospiraceae bacterium]|nr:hypothetical protein [Lachnospiraceae bacterium]